MKLYFKLKDFMIEPSEKIDHEIADKIYEYHFLPMNGVRITLGIPVWPSQNSSYRSKEYELSKGRSGGSQHCFIKKGATDWTCKDFENNKEILLEEMILQTEYTRFAVYKGFIHADHKKTASGKRELFDSGSNPKWIFKKFI